jgi:hypothetical protein
VDDQPLKKTDKPGEAGWYWQTMDKGGVLTITKKGNSTTIELR